MFAGLNKVYYMLHCTKACKFSIQHKCQINSQFSKKSDKIICLIEWFANGIAKSANFLSAAVSESIYRDTYYIALHVLPYVSYRMTAISS